MSATATPATMRAPTRFKAEKLTPDRLARLTADIRDAGARAREHATAEQDISYAYMTGALQAILAHLVGELAGPDAREQVEAAHRAMDGGHA